VLKKKLENQGARTFSIPTIEIVPRKGKTLDRAVRRVIDYDWLFFTSVNGVEIFLQRAQEMAVDKTLFPRICSIGPATSQAIRKFGFEVAIQPGVFQAEGLLEEFNKLHSGNISGLKILLPRASRAREILPETLRKQAAQVDVIPIYDTVVPDENRILLKQTLIREPVDLITLTSSSTVHHLVEMARESVDLSRFEFASIGPITSETAQNYGLSVVTQPEKSTIPDLVDSIIAYLDR
jgi:uroporphyrinogen III methyltransferase/synthase